MRSTLRRPGPSNFGKNLYGATSREPPARFCFSPSLTIWAAPPPAAGSSAAGRAAKDFCHDFNTAKIWAVAVHMPRVSGDWTHCRCGPAPATRRLEMRPGRVPPVCSWWRRDGEHRGNRSRRGAERGRAQSLRQIPARQRSPTREKQSASAQSIYGLVFF